MTPCKSVAPPGHEQVASGRAVRAQEPESMVGLLGVIRDLVQALGELADRPGELQQALDLVDAAAARHRAHHAASPWAIAVLDLITVRPGLPGAAVRVMRALVELLDARDELVQADPATFVRADHLVTLAVVGKPGGEA